MFDWPLVAGIIGAGLIVLTIGVCGYRVLRATTALVRASERASRRDTAPFNSCGTCYFWKHLEEGYGHCNRFDVADGQTVLGDRWGKINADQIIECGAIKPTIKVEALWFGTPSDFGCRAWKPESWEMTSDWRFDRD